MTRFARAKGSKASNEKLPEDATSWSEMKNQLLEKKKQAEEAKKKQKANRVRLDNYNAFLLQVDEEKSKTTKWAEFSTNNKRLSTVKNNVTDNGKNSSKTLKQKRNKVQKDVTTKLENTSIPVQSDSSRKIKQNIQNEMDNIDRLHNNPKKGLKQATMGVNKNKKSKANKQGNSEMIKNKNVKGNKRKMQEISTRLTKKSKLDNTLSEGEIKKIEKKKQKRLRQLEKKKLKRQQNNPDSESQDIPTEQHISTIQSQKKRLDFYLNNKDGHFSENNETLKTTSKGNIKDRKKRIKPPLIDSKQKQQRRKKLQEKMIINGKEIEIAYVDGFPIKKEDAERIKQLRKEMMIKGLPRSEIKVALKLERRRAEKAFAREKKKVCFNCRKSGHNLSECPELGQQIAESAGTGICFKCGSTEHTHFECKVVRGQEFKYAQCFICHEQGHIARQCPDNARGLYPKGGACKVCGDVTHLKKDCPKYQAQQQQLQQNIQVEKINCYDNPDGLGQSGETFKEKVMKRPNKVIKF